MELIAVRHKEEYDCDPDTSYLEQEGWEDRLQAYRDGLFSFVGLWIEADVVIGGIVQTFRSGGLWGIEDDCGASYRDEVYAEEWEALKAVLKEVGLDVVDVPARSS